jgi:hypothetical protein
MEIQQALNIHETYYHEVTSWKSILLKIDNDLKYVDTLLQNVTSKKIEELKTKIKKFKELYKNIGLQVVSHDLELNGIIACGVEYCDEFNTEKHQMISENITQFLKLYKKLLAQIKACSDVLLKTDKN